MNRTILIGRITRDLELKKTANQASVVSFTVAVNRRSVVEGQPEADFINCVAWNKTAENMAKYCSKGSQIAIEGRIQTRNYDNASGQKVYVTEVVCDMVQFIDTRNSGERAQTSNFGQQSNSNSFAQQNTQTAPQQVFQAAPVANNNFYAQQGQLEKDFDNSDNSYSIMDDDLPF